MPLVRNPFMAGNWVWECRHCGKVFAMVDDGKIHEVMCNGEYKPPSFTGYQITIFATNLEGEQSGFLKKNIQYIKNFSNRKEMFEILDEILVFWESGHPSEILVHFDARRA